MGGVYGNAKRLTDEKCYILGGYGICRGIEMNGLAGWKVAVDVDSF